MDTRNGDVVVDDDHVVRCCIARASDGLNAPTQCIGIVRYLPPTSDIGAHTQDDVNIWLHERLITTLLESQQPVLEARGQGPQIM